MRALLVFIVVACLSIGAYGQQVQHAKKIIDTLTSPVFWGRGYVNQGMEKAAHYLSQQFQTIGLKPLNSRSYLQHFTLPVNTFPGNMEVVLDGVKLVPGRDFIVAPESSGFAGIVLLEQRDSVHFSDASGQVNLTLQDKLTWSVAQEQGPYTSVIVSKQAVSQVPQKLNINIQNRFVKSFKASNVCGMIAGAERPDSFLVFTAHFDHLGGMGTDTYFPGANDNASGIALLLALAKHYATHPPRYSVAFIAVAAEEAGLVGSKYFTEHPQLSLEKIRFLTNVDLVGTGEDGATVVNATEFPDEYKWLNEINAERGYLVKINARGKAANSDHYWFTEKGVPAFFLYTLGGIKAYHDVYDRAETLPLTEFDGVFKLLVEFNARIMN